MKRIRAALGIGATSGLVTWILSASGWITTTPDILLRRAYGLDASAVELGWLTGFVFWVAAFGFAWTAMDIFHCFWRAAVAVAGGVLVFTFSMVVALYGAYFSPFPALFAIVMSSGLWLAYSRSEAGRRTRRMERMLRTRVSRRNFRALLEGNEEFTGRFFEGTVLVCDIVNLKNLLELMAPEDCASMTNLFFQTTSDFLVEAGGCLFECGGGGVGVVFGVPVEDENHRVAASRAVVDLMGRLDALNRECDATWHHRLDCRIGVATGRVLAAGFGGSRFAGYGVAGLPVKLARRLCDAAQYYGCRNIVPGDVVEPALESLELRPVEMVKGRGERRRMEFFEILGAKGALSPESERSREHFWKGVFYYRERNWDSALEEFESARISGLPDPLLDFYLRRTERSRKWGADFEEATTVVWI